MEYQESDIRLHYKLNVITHQLKMKMIIIIIGDHI